MAYRHSVSVAGVVVRDDGKILAIRRRDNGDIQAPGGILEEIEPIEAGVAREVEEETGYRVAPRHLTGVYKNVKLGVVALVFLCELVGGEPAPTDEATEILWLDRAEAVEAMSEAFAVRVSDALLDGPWPRVRHHDGVRLLEAAAT